MQQAPHAGHREWRKSAKSFYRGGNRLQDPLDRRIGRVGPPGVTYTPRLDRGARAVLAAPTSVLIGHENLKTFSRQVASKLCSRCCLGQIKRVPFCWLLSVHRTLGVCQESAEQPR